MSTAHLSYAYAVNYAMYAQLLARCGVKQAHLFVLQIG